MKAQKFLQDGTIDSDYGMITTNVGGKSLDFNSFSYSTEEICKMVEEVGEVLSAIGSSGLVHGDMKPANTVLARDCCDPEIDCLLDGRYNIIDFESSMYRKNLRNNASGTGAGSKNRGQPLSHRRQNLARTFPLNTMIGNL